MTIRSPDSVEIVPRRRWLVYALAAGLIGGHAIDAATSGDHWPISSYPMYSELAGHEFRLIRLVGVSERDPSHHVPIDAAFMRATLLRASRRPDAQAQIAKVITAYAGGAGFERPDHGGPFSAYRVYEQNWTLRADANPQRKPDRATLLFEIRRADVRPATPATRTTTSSAAGEDARAAR